MEELDLELIDKRQYSGFVKDAVRYGYQYRCEAERNMVNEAEQFHYCLAEASSFLLWLGELVIAGIAYDMIKKYAIQLWDRLMQMRVVIPKDVNELLIEEDELKRFVTFVDEFNRGQLNISAKEIEYIKEEIMADYLSKRGGHISTFEEWMVAVREAMDYANSLLSKRD